jgi:hypothetical protein
MGERRGASDAIIWDMGTDEGILDMSAAMQTFLCI